MKPDDVIRACAERGGLIGTEAAGHTTLTERHPSHSLEWHRHGPATLQHHDAVLGSLRHAGFSVGAAAHAYSLLDSYMYGLTLNEQSLPFETSDEVTEVGATMLGSFPCSTIHVWRSSSSSTP